MGIAQQVAHEMGKSILCVTGGYTALHKLLWRHWDDTAYCLIFCCMSAKVKFGVSLSCDAILAWHMPSLCVRLCGVDVAYRRLSD